MEYLEEIVLLIGVFRRHDPKGIMWDHYKLVRLIATYDHERPPDDSLFEGGLSYDEVRERRMRQPSTQGLGFPYNENP